MSFMEASTAENASGAADFLDFSNMSPGIDCGSRKNKRKVRHCCNVSVKASTYEAASIKEHYCVSWYCLIYFVDCIESCVLNWLLYHDGAGWARGDPCWIAFLKSFCVCS